MKICPNCGFEQANGHAECLQCGVIFAKLKNRTDTTRMPLQPPTLQQDNGLYPSLKLLLFPVPKQVDPIILGCKAILLVLLAIWGAHFIFSSIASNYAGHSFMHLVNLPFHEAGHIIFSPFGRFLQVLGGSLMQLLVPVVCMAALLIQTRDAFGAAVAQWWLGESFMDLAPYINDARALELMLLGGVTGKDVEDYHDWEYLLRKLGILNFDHFLAYCAQFMGIILMLTALVWAMMTLWVHHKALRQTDKNI